MNHGQETLQVSCPLLLDPKVGKGRDAALAYDCSPPDFNENDSLLTAGVRFNA
jgi:hypothetical protein